MDTKAVLEKIKSSVLTFEPDAEIVLFGSEARGEAGKNSDIDLLILLEGTRTHQQKAVISSALYDIELETGKVISAFILSQNDWEQQQFKSPFYYEVEREGIRL